MPRPATACGAAAKTQARQRRPPLHGATMTTALHGATMTTSILFETADSLHGGGGIGEDDSFKYVYYFQGYNIYVFWFLLDRMIFPGV